jgi:hypothetical protein
LGFLQEIDLVNHWQQHRCNTQPQAQPDRASSDMLLLPDWLQAELGSAGTTGVVNNIGLTPSQPINNNPASNHATAPGFQTMLPRGNTAAVNSNLPLPNACSATPPPLFAAPNSGFAGTTTVPSPRNTSTEGFRPYNSTINSGMALQQPVAASALGAGVTSSPARQQPAPHGTQVGNAAGLFWWFPVLAWLLMREGAQYVMHAAHITS